ncbi:neurotrophin-4-like [Gigantopelta aegis]|uniref:neurotrophin-4-like n=1 Tax=Gigantopelta aegis TaxID=1735272 RepID=UPI001B8876E6|nr:neurotrophin-4-like [Gigantopelta aegis]
MNDTQVEIFQPEGTEGRQWFYTVRCDSENHNSYDQECPLCCRGISSRYASRCITRKSYVIAFVKKLEDTQYDWNWIQVDSSCDCAIFEIVP